MTPTLDADAVPPQPGVSHPQPDAKSPAPWLRQRERGNMFWLRVMSWLSLRLGRRLSRLVLYFIALYFLVVVGPARRASRDYLRRVLPHEPRWRDLYRHFFCFASTVHDRVYLLNDRFDVFDVRVTGNQALHDWHAQTGRGSFLFGAHLGSFEVLRALSRRGIDMAVVGAMFPDNARQINDTLAAINPRVMHEIIPLGRVDSILHVHQRLSEGAAIGILADRSVSGDQYVDMPFLGGVARFPTGPFRMAAVLREPIFFMAGLYQGGGRYEVSFEKISDGLPAGVRTQREAHVRAVMSRYVEVLERHCRAAPFNWFNYYDFWSK